MFINFAKKIFELLVSDEFSYIRQESDSLVYDTEAFSLYKDKGSVLYIVSVINGAVCSKEKFNLIINKYSSLLDGENRAQVILMNIIVNDAENLLAFDEDYAPGKKSYVFTYRVTLETKELIIDDEQPDLLGLESSIKQALIKFDETYVNGTHFITLQNELIEKYSLKIKSGNCLLTIILICLNTAVWTLMELSGGSGDTWTLISFGALTRELVINQHEYFRLFSSIFLHIGIFHLVNNCLALYIFGSRIEKYFGKLWLMLIFISSAFVGNLLTVYFIPNLSCGASGGIFGLLGVILSVSYRTKRSFDDLSPYLIIILCVYSVGMGFIMPAVNNFAHIGGFAAGLVFGGLLKLTVNNAE